MAVKRPVRKKVVRKRGPGGPGEKGEGRAGKLLTPKQRGAALLAATRNGVKAEKSISLPWLRLYDAKLSEISQARRERRVANLSEIARARRERVLPPPPKQRGAATQSQAPRRRLPIKAGQLRVRPGAPGEKGEPRARPSPTALTLGEAVNRRRARRRSRGTLK